MIISGSTTLFLEPNTDTDIIIPARFLKRTSLDGFEPFAFYEKRYLPETECYPTMEAKDFIFKKKLENPECLINHRHSQEATFLITWFNFGCGSSREHAVYALRNYKVIIGSAPSGKSSFADIFRDNCRQNLIRTPIIQEKDHQSLIEYVRSGLENHRIELQLDTEQKKIYTSDGKIEAIYELPDHHEDYIKKASDPFEMARMEVMRDLEQIDNWNQKHHQNLAKYPHTTPLSQ